MGSVSTFIFVLFFLVVDIGTVLADGPPSYNQTYPWASPNPGQPSAICRCFPGDLCWPSDDTWQAFNTTLGGKLVKTVPLAAPCHDDTFTTYDAGQCQAIQAQWFEPQVHYESSSSIMAPYFTNYSCDPFLPRSAECVVGSYVEYSVNVTEPEDISKTIWFATYFNIRLVIRNTGHDYNGKSSGPGAIAIWTHHLKDIQFPDYASPSYTGKAVKAGAGVQAFEAYDAAAANQLQVVGGECPTVGLAGGYPQGGGHSSLSSKYGLAADQVLEWEVVDSTGAVLRAAPDENPDLFWALTGGGGGTYGVVTSMTSKAHADIPTSGANLTFTSAAITQDQFYDCVATFHNLLPTLVDAGAVAVWFITNQSFVLSPLTGPGIPSSFYPDALKPLTDQLSQLGVNYSKPLPPLPYPPHTNTTPQLPPIATSPPSSLNTRLCRTLWPSTTSSSAGASSHAPSSPPTTPPLPPPSAPSTPKAPSSPASAST